MKSELEKLADELDKQAGAARTEASFGRASGLEDAAEAIRTLASAPAPAAHGGEAVACWRIVRGDFRTAWQDGTLDDADVVKLCSGGYGVEFAYLRSAPAPMQQARAEGVPAGWKLVPVEPTPEMLRSGFLSESDGFDIETPSDAPGLVYRAMLAASPEPPTAAELPYEDYSVPDFPSRLAPVMVDAYIRNLPWSDDTPDIHRTLVAGNLRAFAAYLASEVKRPNAAKPTAQEGVLPSYSEALASADDVDPLEGLLANLAHEAGDVDDACPSIEDDEDAYWAWRQYHAIRDLRRHAQPVGEVDEAMRGRAAEAFSRTLDARAAYTASQIPRLQFDAAMRAALTGARLPAGAGVFDFAAHLAHQREWSEATFGPGPRTAGVCDHIRKELKEVEAAPHDSEEWIDVIILALDGAWRAGMSPQQIIGGIVAKQAKNEARTWPDWRTADPGKAIEHDRSHDAWPREGDLVRYGDGSTALAILCEPHAGGWHGFQCMGGYTFFARVYPPSEADMRMWLECAKWRQERPTTEADERIRRALRPATNDQVKP